MGEPCLPLYFDHPSQTGRFPYFIPSYTCSICLSLGILSVLSLLFSFNFCLCLQPCPPFQLLQNSLFSIFWPQHAGVGPNTSITIPLLAFKYSCAWIEQRRQRIGGGGGSGSGGGGGGREAGIGIREEGRRDRQEGLMAERGTL